MSFILQVLQGPGAVTILVWRLPQGRTETWAHTSPLPSSTYMSFSSLSGLKFWRPHWGAARSLYGSLPSVESLIPPTSPFPKDAWGWLHFCSS